ncbi:hypothetical protein EGP95_02930 [bacterium]|nr:hypothetical protein [bacterium]
MEKVMNKRNMIIFGVILVALILVAIFLGKEKHAYPTKVEKLNFNVSKCGTLAQSKAKRVAKKVKINYEKIDKIVGYDETTGKDVVDKVFKINISNIKEDYRVEIYNDYTKETKMLEVEDRKASYETIYSKDIIKYTINIISKNGKCKNDVSRSLTVTLPVINNYASLNECTKKENKKYKYCKEEIYESLPSIEEFYKGVK